MFDVSGKVVTWFAMSVRGGATEDGIGLAEVAIWALGRSLVLGWGSMLWVVVGFEGIRIGGATAGPPEFTVAAVFGLGGRGGAAWAAV